MNFNRLSEACWSNSILELWSFDQEKIDSLQTIEEVSEVLDSTTISPVYGFSFKPEDWLGEVAYDDEGKIVRARAAKMLYVIQATSTDEFNNKIVVRYGVVRVRVSLPSGYTKVNIKSY